MVTLKEYLNSDRIDYFPFGSKGYIMDWLLRTEQYWILRGEKRCVSKFGRSENI